nr:polysaccharide pyruvyl transferase family protein [Clostridia bacterium]
MLYYGLTWRPRTDNLGDDLTALAALQHLPRVDRVLNADALDAPLSGLQDDDRLVLLAHGLFLRSSAHWPTEKHIAPVCIGVHISEEDAWGLPFASLDGAGLDALRACSPIAARDLRTANRLAKMNIPHTLTASLVLTLEHPPVKRSGVICCDVPEDVVNLVKSFRQDAAVVTHELSNPAPDFTARMEAARAMVARYASAEMVFTRRLHCAMACLALGTPVLLLYRPEYEDVSRFAPMDEMVRRQGVEDFIREVRLHGMPAPWRNPADVGVLQRVLKSAVSEGLRRAESQALPLVPQEIADNWKQERIRLMMQTAAAKIQRLENQHYDDLHGKFTQLLQEEDAKASLQEIFALPEVENALRAASLRLKKEKLSPKEQKILLADHKRNMVDVDDLIRKAQGALSQLGWPENNDD